MTGRYNLSKLIIFMFVLPFLVFSCSAPVQTTQKKEAEFVSVTLCRSVDNTGIIARPLAETNRFAIEDKEINALVKLENVMKEHMLTWEWWTPNEEMYSIEKISIKPSEGKYMPVATAWHKILIHGEDAERLLGRWNVNVFLDDTKKDVTFELSEIVIDPNIKIDQNKEDPNKFAFIIGIENYLTMSPAPYAKNDAYLVKQYFKKILGIPGKNIFLLVDKHATKSLINTYLKTTIPNHVKSNSILYVYFSGHGGPLLNNDPKEDPNDLYIPYLFPVDADKTAVAETGYKLSTFYDDLRALNVKERYVFLDCCFSRMPDPTEKVIAPAGLKKRFTGNIISITATSPKEESYPYELKKQGIFTYFFLLGLRGGEKGEVDTNKDNKLSFSEIYDYVKINVPIISKEQHGKFQNPSILPSIEEIRDKIFVQEF